MEKISNQLLRLLRRKSLTRQTRPFSSSPQNEDVNIITSPFRDVKLPELPYFPFVWKNKDLHLQRTALVDQITGNSMDYSQSYNTALKFASAIKDFMGGIKGPKVLGIMLTNCIEYPLVFSGAAGVKVTTTTINPAYTPREIAHQLSISKARVVVTTSDMMPKLKEGADLLGEQIEAIIVDSRVEGCHHFYDFIEKHHPDEDVLDKTIDVDEDIVTLPFSSGTTGKSKGVMLTHRNLTANISQVLHGHPDQALFFESTRLWENITLCVLPLYHIYGMNVTMGPSLMTGTKLVMIPKFDPKSFVKSLEDHQPTFLQLAPPLVSFLVNAPEVKSHHLGSAHHVMVGAAPLGPSLVGQFYKKFPQTILREGWGMTECSPIGLVTPTSTVRVGSCGVPVPNTRFKIVDDSGRCLGPGESGELCCSGPMVMKGYIDLPEATKETVRDGWLHTGDVAHHDKDGFIYVVDRIKELIKVKGFQVPPAELEDLIRALEGVEDVAVIGVPDERSGEVPRAYVVKSDGSGVTEEAVKKHVGENAAEYKQVAGGVEFLDAIPKSGSGKVLKRILLDDYNKKLK